jgi:hypothetical protein
MNRLLPYWPRPVVQRKLRNAAVLSVFVATAVLMLA